MKKNSILDHDSLLAFENLDIRSFSSEKIKPPFARIIKWKK